MKMFVFTIMTLIGTNSYAQVAVKCVPLNLHSKLSFQVLSFNEGVNIAASQSTLNADPADVKEGMVKKGCKWGLTGLGTGFGVAALVGGAIVIAHHSKYSDAVDEAEAYQLGNELEDKKNAALILTSFSSAFLLLSVPFWVF